MEHWQEIKEDFIKLRDEVAKQTKELAESETSIAVIERNFGDTPDVANLRTHLGARKLALQQKAIDLKKIHEKASALGHESYKLMKQHLNIFNDIVRTLSSDEEWISCQEDAVVQVAKIIYPNLKDNHQLRSDPDIAGVKKFQRNDIMNALELPLPSNSSNVELETFFSPICDTQTISEWSKRFGSTKIISSSSKDEQSKI